MNRTKLAHYLDLTEEELLELGLTPEDIQQDSNPSGAAAATYFFNVPATTPDRILGKKGWSLGDRVDIDAAVVDGSKD